MNRMTMGIVAVAAMVVGARQNACVADCCGYNSYCATQVVNGVAWRYTVYSDECSGSGYVTLRRQWVDGHYDPAVDPSTGGAIAIPATLGGYAVTQISDESFANCSNLTSITIPAGVTYINSSAFDGCDSLMLFSVASGNANYASKSGLLLDKEQKTLVRCPAALSTVTIPSTVTTVNSGAFSGCANLTSLDIPPHLTAIGSSAFEGCENLSRVTGGYGLVTVQEGAFDDTPLVTEAEDGPVRVGNIWVAYAGGISEELVIPEGVAGISFSLQDVNDLTLPSSVTSSGAVHGFAGSAIRVPSRDYWLAFHDSDGWSSCCCCCGSSFYEGEGYDLYFGGELVADVSIPGSFTNVPYQCFYKCTSLQSVTLGEGIRSIGYEAFGGCTSLEHVSIPSTLTASFAESCFAECWNLSAFDVAQANPRYASHDGVLYNQSRDTLIRCPLGKCEVTLPATVTRIESSAFSDCEQLEAVYIPSSVREIGSCAFSGCGNLQSVTGGAGVRVVGDDAFNGTPFVGNAEEGPVRLGNVWVAYQGDIPETLVIPEGITDIGFGIGNVADLTLPSTFQPDWLSFAADVLRIPSVNFWFKQGGNIGYSSWGPCGESMGEGYYLFVKGSQVTDVTIPGSMEKVPDSLFSHCLSLTSVTIQNGVAEIGYDAFYKCANLTEANLPESVKTIGEYAFNGCTQLDFELPSVVDWIGEYAVRNTLAYQNAVEDADGGVIYLGNWCFGIEDEDEDNPLASVSIKAGTRGIASCAFEYTAIAKVAIPNSVVTIADHAFSGTEITSVTLPTGLKRLGRHAFASSKLASIPKLPTTLVQVGDGVFKSCDGGVTPAYAKLAKGWIVQDGWLLGYKCYDYHYDSEEDAWYSDDEDEDYDWPERLVVPTGVKHVADEAFDDEDGADGVAELVLPNGIETIGADAFHGLELNEISIPASVSYLGGGAFAYADGPITFLGTPPEIGTDEDGDGPFSEASIGYFTAGTAGWTNGMAFAGLTMIARGDPTPVTPSGVTFEPVDDVECDAGETISVTIACTSESAVTYKATGLPKGLKFDSKKLVVSGAPTVPGKYTVSITGTNKKKEAATLTFNVSVANFTSEYFSVDDGLHFAPGATIDPIDLSGCGLDFAAGDSLAAKGLPKGLAYNAKTYQITGAPTVPGNVTVTFTAKVKTTDEKGKAKTVSSVATVVWTVDPLPVLTVTALDAEGDEATSAVGAVTGGGSYLAGKKITLKATAKSGCVFAGWQGLDEARVGSVDLRNPSVAYVTGAEDEEVFALFASSEEDRASLAASLQTPIPDDEDEYEELSYAPFDGSFHVGVMTTQQVAVTSLSLPSVKVTGLPTGLKYDKKTQQIVGIPTKAGAFTIKIVASNASGASVTEKIPVTVLALPAWAQGSYAGKIGLYDHDDGSDAPRYHGPAIVSISSAGKISGYFVFDGKRYSFAKNGYEKRLADVSAHCPVCGSPISWYSWSDESGRYGGCNSCSGEFPEEELVSVTNYYYKTCVSVKVGTRIFALPLEMREDTDSELTGWGCADEPYYDVQLLSTPEPDDNYWYMVISLRQTLIGRAKEVVLPAKTLKKCFAGDAGDECLDDGDWLTVKTYATGRTLAAGRIAGNAVSWSSAFAPTEIQAGEMTGLSYFYAPPVKRTAFAGSFLAYDLWVDRIDKTIAPAGLRDADGDD